MPSADSTPSAASTKRSRRSVEAAARPCTTATVALCVGKDCRKRNEHRLLRRDLRRNGTDIVDVACIGVCAGPIVALDPYSATPTVLQKLRSKRARRDIVATSTTGRLSKELKERRISGKRYARAIQRLRRRLDRRVGAEAA